MPFPANHSSAQKIWSLLTPAERRNAMILLGLMLIGMVLETLGVGLAIPALALLTQQDLAHNYPTLQPVLQALGNPNQKTLVIGGMLALIGVYLIKTLFLSFLAWRQTRFSFELQARLSQRLFTIYLRQPYTFHLSRNSAQLIRNIGSEVNQFTHGALTAGMLLLTESLVLIGLCSLLLILEPLGALITASLLGIASWGFQRITRKHTARWANARQYHEGSRIQSLQQGLGGAKDVKLLGRETDFLEQYRMHNDQNARVGQLHSTLLQLPRLWLELFAISGLALLTISMLAQSRALETLLPTLGLFAAAAFRLIPSVNRILSAIHSFRYNLPVIATLHSELNLTEPDAVGIRTVVTPFSTALELSQITYTYPNATAPALKNISLTIHRGESVGFIGGSGAGKSTLVDILLGLLPLDTGEIRVDSKNIRINLRNWQDQIGYVPQSIYLTDDTLRRNVAFGLANEQIDDTAVRHAIQAAQLDEFVASLPDELETFVGERGIRLSGGQRQRVGIARALYHNPAVLVLDEATSALDAATETGVMQAVISLHGIKTIIIVAHRLSTVEHCDRLYRLEEGRLVAEGAAAAMLEIRKNASSA